MILKRLEQTHPYHNLAADGAGRWSLYIKIIACTVLLIWNAATYARDPEKDSLLRIVEKGKDDSVTVNALISLTIDNAQSSSDTATAYANRAKDIAVRISFKRGEAFAYKWLAIINNYKGNYYEALVNSNKALSIFDALGDKVGTSNILNNLGAFYADRGEDSKAVEYYLKSLDLARQSGNKLRIETALSNIGVTYFKNPATKDVALDYYLKALPYALEIKDNESIGILYTNIGEVYAAKKEVEKAFAYYNSALKTLGDASSSIAYTYTEMGKLYKQKEYYDSADIFFDKAYAVARQNDSPIDILHALIGKGQLQLTIGNNKKAIEIFTNALPVGRTVGSTPELTEVYDGLSAAYTKMDDYKNAFLFESLLNDLNDVENKKRLDFSTATLAYTTELQKQSERIAMLVKENEQKDENLEREKFARNVSIIALIVVLIISVVLLININQRKKLNRLLSIQKKQIEVQKANVEKAFTDLKATQSQLVHSEKMASLGELTAGIAHEIQNPLNFVNNFSEVNTELIEELKTMRAKRNGEDKEMEGEILGDIELNLRKIMQHGKRAENIVKGMLQHSRTNTGKKESTDINALADECLRLSFHGLLAKDKYFNVNFTTQLDRTIGNIDVVSQDMSRVFINLFNNAFYAVNEKSKTADASYKPTVLLKTKRVNNHIEIYVKDNGSGIPRNIADKIFQPFFTTKPTGQGTGLGLSLSYDIIKAHGGDLKVESKEGEGSEFIIQLFPQ